MALKVMGRSFNVMGEGAGKGRQYEEAGEVGEELYFVGH